jgi:Fe-S-cluster containining protein
MKADPFYAEGLRFSCTRCSVCCRGEPGYVFLSKEDLRKLLRRLGLDFKSFFREYCTLVDEGMGMALTLRENAAYDCVLWGAEGCTVYDDRPAQCSTYPFWASILDSMASWNAEARNCPGIGGGELRSRKYIEKRMIARRGAGSIVLSYGVDLECLDENTILGSEGLGSDPAHAFQG